MRRVVSVFLPRWSTDRVRLRDGAGEAPLVLARKEGGRRLITSVDEAAARMGLHPGMAASQAQAMAPGLALGEADPQGDAAALRRLAAWCLRLSPLAAPCPEDGVWIDSTGCDHLHEGGEAGMLDGLVRRLNEAGISARAAVAETPGCAHAVARFGGAGVVACGGAAAAMAPLPVPALRLDEETVDALGRLGFETVGQLMAAPRAPLVRRFGGTALRRLDQALGRAPEPIEPVLPPELCRVRQGFPEPIATPEDLARVVRLLAGRLCEKLLARGEGASRLDLVFTRVDGSAAVARVGTAAPTRDAAHLTRLLLPRIEGIDPGFGIETAMLAAPLSGRLGARQVVLGPAGPSAGDLTGLVDVLSNRLGERRVFRVAAVESDLPERSVRRVAALSAGCAAWPQDLPRPVRLLDPPRPIEAVSLLPDQPPVRFTWRRVPHRVRRADGPERVFGEWWREDAQTCAVRDYFQVEDDAGRRFWIFREGDGEHEETGDLSWYLHGFFG